MDSLSIVVPAFNETRRLPALFEGLYADADHAAQAAGLTVLEVIVVDDGSTDETPSLLAERERSDPRVRVIRYEPNRGKGAAVRRGALEAAGDYVLVTDVDLSTPLSEVAGLISALREGSDVAIGSRGLPSSRIGIHQPFHRELMGKAFNGLLRLLTGLPYRDTQCGFKLFGREAARALFEVQRIDGFAFDAELCVNARRLGLRVSEVPVAWYDQRDTKVKLMGSSLQMALDLLRIVVRSRRPLPPVTERVESAESERSRSVSAGR
jgi:dolichyl-phosphate beta-glucosyltransferase